MSHGSSGHGPHAPKPAAAPVKKGPRRSYGPNHDYLGISVPYSRAYEKKRKEEDLILGKRILLGIVLAIIFWPVILSLLAKGIIYLVVGLFALFVLELFLLIVPIF